jgi:hypothetical protein
MKDTPANHYWASSLRDSWLDVPWGIGCILCFQTLIRPSVTWSRNRLSSDQWILRHVRKFQRRRAKHHAKRVRRCRSTNSGRLSPWFKSRWFQTVSNCSCWQTSIGQRVLFEYGTGCEWHPSNQTLQCPVVTIRCYPWSAGSWQVSHCWFVCVFSPRDGWRPIALKDIFVVCMPIICHLCASDIRLRTMLTENDYIF